MKRILLLIIIIYLFPIVSWGQLYWRTDGTSGLWTDANWSNPASATGGSAYTANTDAIFSANSTLTFATFSIGNVTVNDGVTVTVTAAGTLSMNGSVRTFNIGTGSTLTWTSQTVTTNSAAGITKSGSGTLNLGALTFTTNMNGGFTLNNGTVIVSGSKAFGNGGFTINGGTIQSSGSSTFTPTSITIGSDFTFTGTGNDIYGANVSLGAVTRTITNSTTSGSRQFSGIISGDNGVGLTINGAGTGTVILSGANTYTGLTTISGSNLQFNRTGGTTIPTTNSITINGGTLKVSTNQTVNDLILSSGSLTVDAGVILTINGTFTLSGGTITNNGTITYGASSTLAYAGSSLQTTTSAELPSSGGPNSLTITNSSGVTLGSNATINGTLTISSGSFDNNGSANDKTFTLGNGATIVMAGGSLTTAPTFGTSVNITYSGSSSQTTSVEVPSTSTVLNNLTISNSNGVLLGASATVNGTLSVSSGDLDLNGKTLTLGSSATLSETAGNTVKGSTGTITTTRDLNAPSSNPVGGIGVVITSGANMGSTVVSRGHAVQSGNSNNGITRYFDITPTNNSGLDATLVFKYDESELNSISESNLRVFRAESPYTTWTLVGGTVDATNNYVTITGVNTFSRWTLGDVNSPLPVELTSFFANTIGSKVQLNWRTATEVNNYGFEVERSQTSNVKSETWEKIGFVQGNGNSNSPKNYSYTDQPTGGKEFKYRLKQIDFDGSFEYSYEVTAKLGNVSTYKLDQNYPNPFNPITKISYTIPQRAYVHLRVYDMLAKQIAELVNVSQEAGRYEVTFDGTNLPSGAYFYKLDAGNYIEVKKLLLVK
jgi:hypothetical protein